MRKVAAILFLLLAAMGVYWFLLRSKPNGTSAPKPLPIALKKHSAPFNMSIDRLMVSYLETKNAFIEDDTTRAKAGARSFISLLDSIPLEELKKDTAMIFETVQANINDIRSNAHSLLEQADIAEMRKDFSMITEMMYPSFFRSINYEGPNLYLQNCPMAFGDDNGANWISNSVEVVNPYLGKIHPKYKASMLHCGEVKDTIKAKQ
jgi:hypothetical protein